MADRRPQSAASEIGRQMQAARMLVAAYRDILKEDKEARHIAIASETNLVEAIEMGVTELAVTKGLRAGLKSTMEMMKARDQRLESRDQRLRDAILTAMEMAGLPKVETPVATVSRKVVPPSVVVVDEKDIPPAFFVPVDPKLDKRAVLDALKSGAAVPGAELSNGSESLQVRFT